MSAHRIPSIERQMVRRARKNVELEKMLREYYGTDSEGVSKDKKSDFNRFVSESGVRYDFSQELNKLLQEKYDDLFDSLSGNNSNSRSPFTSTSFDYLEYFLNSQKYIK